MPRTYLDLCFLLQPFKNNYASFWDGVFIGLTDRVVEGSFNWETTGNKPNYTNWLDGQPDDYLQNEDCAVMIYGNPGKWNDGLCDQKLDGTMTMCEKILPNQQCKGSFKFYV